MEFEQISISKEVFVVKKVAVFIDGDNVNYHSISSVWPLIEMMGDITVSRAYGNWAGPILKGLKEKLSTLSVSCINQTNNGKKGNSTDIAMVIDAIDQYINDPFDIAVIFSGDADFTPLVHWLKNKKIKVIGAGMINYSKVFEDACDLFLKMPSKVEKGGKMASEIQNVIKMPHQNESGITVDSLVRCVASVINIIVSQKKPLLLSQAGAILSQTFPGYTPQSYGFKKTSDLLVSNGMLVITGESPELYIRLNAGKHLRHPDQTATAVNPIH